MKIVRQSDSELVLEESSLWISLVLALASLPLFYASTLPGRRGNLILALFFAAGGLVWLRKATVVFDAGQHTVRWRRMRFFRSASGAVDFSAVTGIGIETCSGSGGATLYRLTLLTGEKALPFTDTYGGGRDRWLQLRDASQRFLQMHRGAALPGAVNDIDTSVRSLLLQGRKLDAIRLVETTQHLNLTSAIQRVNEVSARLRTGR